jgi:hypothetical protein
MRRLLPSLSAAAVASLGIVLCAGSVALAQSSDADVCASIEHELGVARESRDHLCSATSAVVDDVLRERVPGAAQAACVSPEQQQRLEGLVKSWSHARSALGQLGAYADGETDRLPPPSGGASALDRLVQRATGDESRPPLAYRRLLVEAMHRIAPRAWRGVRARGPAGLDAWFSGRDPLGADVVVEAQQGSEGAVGAAGPPLSAALRLVFAYEVVAGCGAGDVERADCTRAHQLQQLLESTGPLLVKRRIQDIWATECATGSAGGVLAWVADFPGPQGEAQASGYGDVTRAAYAKLFSCYLADASTDASFGAWLDAALPRPRDVTADQLARLDAIKGPRRDGDAEDACARAVHALERAPVAASCTAPSAEDRAGLEAWTSYAASHANEATDTVRVCRQYARLLWEGAPARIAGSYAHPPSLGDMVVVDATRPVPAMARLRSLCAARVGAVAEFPEALEALGAIARGFGESTEAAPWRIDPASGVPFERSLYERADRASAWAKHLVTRQSSCDALDLPETRCGACAALPSGAAYDCALVRRLDGAWQRRTRELLGTGLLAVLVGAVVLWLRRMLAARRELGGWARNAAAHLSRLGLPARRDPRGYVFPSCHDVLVVHLPQEAAWERWGERAVVVRATPGLRLAGRDIDRAALVAYRAGAAVGIVVHGDEVAPDLSAVRAILEWAARGGKHAAQIVSVSESRLHWARSARDVLDLVEETTLRGDPFEQRGPITSSSQFFNRERLVSGLLATAQGGHWQVITGLRRFGKSSLALEVARRLPGPSAYVDLAAFHHEIGKAGDPSRAADRILRYVCHRMTESARARYGDADLPQPFDDDAVLDATALAGWFGALAGDCGAPDGNRPPMLIVLDEIEQALAVGPENIGHALDVLAIVIGRLRGAFGVEPGRSTVAVFLCSALHPLLWAPLGVLAGQSVMGSFPSVCVPRLSDEAAAAMMRSLGLRHGIRFGDEALEAMVAASHGIPLLLRRIGSSVLELYDGERARHGGLGAVDVGPEGAGEAVARETRPGSPLRVWVESEIGEGASPAGAMLRELAREDSVDVATLHRIAERAVARVFASTGVARTLAPEETLRRVEEAAIVILRLLGETGLLEPLGDLTAPDAYALPDGVLRSVLRRRSDRPDASGVAVSPG